MGFAFHLLCPRYSGTLTTTAPRPIRLWEIFILDYERLFFVFRQDFAHMDTNSFLFKLTSTDFY